MPSIIRKLIYLPVLMSLNAFAFDTPAQVPIGVAVGPNTTVEVNFANMVNPEDCSYNGAYVVNHSLDRETKSMMLSTLLTAKASNQRVRVRLSGCTDRPQIINVFLESTWIGGF
ncbi:hypothetical protein [Vibrio europaeus]|uniref:hypothetical protein n=1 Tax=Vibrio europaeus TaxID=300876 RepID=UPI00233F78E0|nr:hypothetical protein [Vibrio europaeus]MDC5855549.1 hypothetical protein [Vibrio europaeus]